MHGVRFDKAGAMATLLSRSLTAIRFARPTTDLQAIVRFYVEHVGLDHLGGFRDHAGYDGAFVGLEDATWHFEFTQHPNHRPTPTLEDVIVLYLAESSVRALAAKLEAHDHQPITHPNPYWSAVGATTFLDPDGYPFVLAPDVDRDNP
jgi:Glyoxalase/Bleomycin resistance protein/Dioxygenase superfamily